MAKRVVDVVGNGAAQSGEEFARRTGLPKTWYPVTGADLVQLRNRFGQLKPVRYLDPVWDTLDGARARLLSVEPDGMLQLGDNDGRPLPDLRHPEQVVAY